MKEKRKGSEKGETNNSEKKKIRKKYTTFDEERKRERKKKGKEKVLLPQGTINAHIKDS